MSSSVNKHPSPSLPHPVIKYVSYNGTDYKLKVRVNIDQTDESTAKLTDSKVKKRIIQELARQNILWEGHESIRSKKIPKQLNLGTTNVRLEPTCSPEAPFKVRICFKSTSRAALPEGQMRILWVTCLQDYRQLFQLGHETNELFFDRSHVMHLFQDINSWTCNDMIEMIDFLEFLTDEAQRAWIEKIKASSSLELIITAIKLLAAKKEVKYILFMQSLLREAVQQFARQPMITQKDLDQFMQIFEYLIPEDQGLFISKLVTTRQLTTDKKLIESLTEAFKRLQRARYRLTTQPTSDVSLLEVISSSSLMQLIIPQVKNLQKNTQAIDIPTVTSHLVCIVTLLETAVSSGVKCLPKHREFDPLYDILTTYKSKSWLTKWTKHEECRIPAHGVNFLAKYAIQLLKLIGSDESKAYTIVRHAFYCIRGLSTLAAAASPGQPWQILKGVFDSSDDFYKAFSFKDTKLRAFIYLCLLQSRYLSEKPNSLDDFEGFVEDLLDLQKEQENKSKISVHHQSFFIQGLIELLHAMQQSYVKSAPRISEKAVMLLKFIQSKNEDGSEGLFRVHQKHVHSHARQHVLESVTQVLDAIYQTPSTKDENSNAANRSSHLFLKAFKNKFFWIESMNKQLKTLKKDQQLIEDTPYIVDLQGTDALGKSASLENLLNQSLSRKRPIVIIGEPGSGKSLFLKKYQQDLLENFQIDSPVPFYASLGSIPNPRENLLEKILEKYDLQDHKEELKKIPTVWFLDAYDEIFLGNKEVPFNIYNINNLDKWPMAKFVFTCRTNMLKAGDDQRYFAPPGKAAALLIVSPFRELEIKSFLEQYVREKLKILEKLKLREKLKIREKLKLREKLKNNETAWTVEQYENFIASLGLEDIIQTPFYLRKMVDYCPKLDTALKSFPEANKDEEEKKNFLLDLLVFEFIRDLIQRESEKTTENKTVRKPSEYLNYILDISKLMQMCQMHSVPERRIHQGGTSAEENKRQLRVRRLNAELDPLKVEKKELLKQLNDKKPVKDELSECEEKIANLENELSEIVEVKKAESELQEYLFGDKYKHLWTDVLIKSNATGEKEFAHTVLYDYFQKLNDDEKTKQRLYALIDTISIPGQPSPRAS